MGIFRSEHMLHKSIRIPKNTSHEIMDEMGRLEDVIEFVDLNKDNLEAKKNFLSIIQRCDEVEKNLHKFEKICESYEEEIFGYDNYDKFIKDLSIQERSIGLNMFDYLEDKLYTDDRKISDLIESYLKIKEGLELLLEKKAVYEKATQLLDLGQPLIHASFGGDAGKMEEGFHSDLNYIAGVVKADDEMRMKRMIFRISRGRAIPTFFNFPENIQKQIDQYDKVYK